MLLNLRVKAFEEFIIGPRTLARTWGTRQVLLVLRFGSRANSLALTGCGRSRAFRQETLSVRLVTVRFLKTLTVMLQGRLSPCHLQCTT